MRPRHREAITNSDPTAMSSAVPPSRKTLLHLYAATLRASRGFSSYNFRNYFLARTKDTFRGIQVRDHSSRASGPHPYDVSDRTSQNESDPAKLSSFYQTAVEDLAVLKRSAIVNSVYGGRKLVVEKDKIERTRGVN
jgi:hypothetical protein